MSRIEQTQEEKESGAEAEEDARFARAAAQVRGYSGEVCQACGNFTMRRAGTCLTCDTCGATTGCS